MSTVGKPLPSDLSYAFESLKNSLVVRLRGRASFDQTPVLDRCFKAIEAHTEPRVVLELSELSYIGSAGLGAFITLRHAVEARHAHIVLVGLSPMVLDLFETSGLTQVFTVFKTLAEAVT